MADRNAQAAYRRARDRRGEPVEFWRVEGDAPNTAIFKAAVNAVVLKTQSAPPIGGFAQTDAITESDYLVIVIDQDLADKHFPLPVQKNDKVLLRGELMNVERSGNSDRSFAGASEWLVLGVQ